MNEFFLAKQMSESDFDWYGFSPRDRPININIIIIIRYLEYDMTEILFVAVQRLKKLQRFAIQQKYLISFWEHQFQCDFRKWIAIDRQFARCRSLANAWKAKKNMIFYIYELNW